MYIGIFAIDSWHIANGIHCPDLKTYSANNLEDLCKKLYLQVKDCELYVYQHEYRTFVKDADELESVIRYNGLGTLGIEKPREGYLKIIDTTDLGEEYGRYTIHGAAFEGKLHTIGKYWYQLYIVGEDIVVIDNRNHKPVRGHVYQLLEARFDNNTNWSTYIFEVIIEDSASIIVEVEQELQFGITDVVESCYVHCYKY